MVRRLVISGGAGLLAVNWALKMRDHWDVHLILHHRKIAIVGVTSHYADLSTPIGALRVVESLAPDLLVNTVALADVDRCEREKVLATQTNVLVAANLAAAANATGSQFIHISSDHLFDGTMARRIETDWPRPINHYGLTKLQAESAVAENHHRALILRTNFFGWGPVYRRSFSDRIIDALRAQERINLFSDVMFSPIFLGTLVDIAHELVTKEVTGILHVVGNESLSKYHFGWRLCKFLGLSTELISPSLLCDEMIQQENLVLRPLDMSLSNDKLTSIIGSRELQLDKMIEDMFKQQNIAHLLASIDRDTHCDQ